LLTQHRRFSETFRGHNTNIGILGKAFNGSRRELTSGFSAIGDTGVVRATRGCVTRRDNLSLLAQHRRFSESAQSAMARSLPENHLPPGGTSHFPKRWYTMILCCFVPRDSNSLSRAEAPRRGVKGATDKAAWSGEASAARCFRVFNLSCFRDQKRGITKARKSESTKRFH